MDIADLALRYGIALLIGVLIGVEREYARLKEEVKSFAGVRTFPLIALLGCSASLLTDLGGAWTFGIIAVLLGLLIAISYAFDAREGRVGLTSEMAALIVFICGALCYWDYMELAAILSVVAFGIRDIILPGEMKELLNKVVESKKAAEANLITRREETAAMRSQANTAKLLAGNATLMRLRELEVLEKVATAGQLSVVCGDNGISEKVMKLI